MLSLLFLLPALALHADEAPTFYRDVLPVLADRCQSCHRPGQAAPMPLLTYKQARPWAKAIRESVMARRMPPWHADAAVARYRNDLSLTEAQRHTLAALGQTVHRAHHQRQTAHGSGLRRSHRLGGGQWRHRGTRRLRPRNGHRTRHQAPRHRDGPHTRANPRRESVEGGMGPSCHGGPPSLGNSQVSGYFGEIPDVLAITSRRESPGQAR